MPILSINSVALLATKPVTVGPHEDLTVVFSERLAEAAKKICSELAKEQGRRDLRVEIY